MSKVAYICSPYRSDSETGFQIQLDRTKEISREVVLAGYDVIVPHLYYPEFLDDLDDEERAIGMQSAVRLLHKCDIMFVFIGRGISKGMKAEIAEAKEKNILMIEFRNMDELKKILKT